VVVALLILRDQLAFGNDRVRDDVGALVEELCRGVLDDAVLLDDIQEPVLREAWAVRNILRQRRR
jgi:hypothetical protein